MKSRIPLLIVFSLLLTYVSYSGEKISDVNKPSQAIPMKVYCTAALQDITSVWAREYSRLNPDIPVEVKTISVPGDKIHPGENIAFVSNKPVHGLGSDWRMAVGREVYVPIINAANPFMKELTEKGISREMFASIYQDPSKRIWGSLVAEGKNIPVHLYLSREESLIQSLSSYLNLNQISTEGIKILNGEELISAIRNDPYALGFCNMANIAVPENSGFADKIKLLPIDKNANGKIDYIEKIYDSPEAFARGVWIGKYPKALYRDIYVVSGAQPSNSSEIAFLGWVLTDGQQFLNLKGYSDLIYSERQSKLDKLNNELINVLPVKESYSNANIALLIILSFVALGLVIRIILRYRKSIQPGVQFDPKLSSAVFDEKSIDVPRGLYYDITHTWAIMEKDGDVRVGINDFLQHITGPVTRIEMKKPGQTIKKGEILLSLIQNGKQLSLYSPISGTIKANNKSLLSKTSIINSSPYSEGWVYMIDPSNWISELRFLTVAEKYIKSLSEEFSRLKIFLANALNEDRIQYDKIVMQDGGVLKDNILADLGPEVWEDFQTEILDKYK